MMRAGAGGTEDVVAVLVLAWFVLLTVGYLTLCVLAIAAARRERANEARRAFNAAMLGRSAVQPTVTIVVPAHDEQATIEYAVRSLLAQNWRQLEVLVVCNGCRDDTLGVLRRAFALVDAPDTYTRGTGGIAAVRSSWASATEPRLRVLDVGRGGKADALNVGLERARGTYFCTVDADSLLARDAIARVVLPFVEEGSDVVAVGSVVRVLNGATVEDGIVTRPGMPRTATGRMQVVEYARGFHLGRSGWAEVGALPIISGAFAAFRTSALRVIGGFRVDTVGEDMEIVLRLHDAFRPRPGRRAIVFVPRPLCWTEVPEDAATLRTQRIRWQHGLVEAALTHRLQLTKASTSVGRSALPFLAVLELLAPVIEAVGMLAIVLAALVGILDMGVAAAFLVLAVSLGLLLGMVGVLLEQYVGGRFVHDARDVVRLFGAAVREQFGPRQRTAWWRLQALFVRRVGTAAWDGVEHHGAGSVATVTGR